MTRPGEPAAPALRDWTEIEHDVHDAARLSLILDMALEHGARRGVSDRQAEAASEIAGRIADLAARLLDDFRALHAADAFDILRRGEAP